MLRLVKYCVQVVDWYGAGGSASWFEVVDYARRTSYRVNWCRSKGKCAMVHPFENRVVYADTISECFLKAYGKPAWGDNGYFVKPKDCLGYDGSVLVSRKRGTNLYIVEIKCFERVNEKRFAVINMRMPCFEGDFMWGNSSDCCFSYIPMGDGSVKVCFHRYIGSGVRHSEMLFNPDGTYIKGLVSYKLLSAREIMLGVGRLG